MIYFNTDVIHFSSDCVYSGNRKLKDGGYTETDTPDADDTYGLTKRLGTPEYGMTLRTSFIGHENRESPREDARIPAAFICYLSNKYV